MENTNPHMTFEQYQRLSADQREFFVFDKLCRIDDVCARLEKLDEKFASKWVETAARWASYLVGGSVITAAMALLFNKQ